MPSEFASIFETLKGVLEKRAKKLTVKPGRPTEYTLVSKSPSPFPQHKGQPMWFAQLRLGKAYVSFHLMPLYMNETLAGTIPPNLKKRMQGKTCFNFKSVPDPEILAELARLTDAAMKDWSAKKWV
jgi:hypothetical protein